MSFNAIGWVMKQSLPAMQKCVLTSLANHLNHKSGLCCPSLTTLAKGSGMSKRSVVNQIDKLEKGNYITVTRETKNKTKLVNKYSLNIPETIAETSDPRPAETAPNVLAPPPLASVLPITIPPDTSAEPPHSDSPLEISPEPSATKPLPEPPLAQTSDNNNQKPAAPLIYPASLKSQERAQAAKLLLAVCCLIGQQEILDVLEAAISSQQIKKSPLSFLSALVKRYLAGTFDPMPGQHIAQKRQQLAAQQRAHAEAEQRNQEAIQKRLAAAPPDPAIAQRINELRQKQAAQNKHNNPH